MKEDKTIVGISTAIGNGGISVIRLSGKDAIQIASKVFKNKNTNVLDFEPRKLYLGEFDCGDTKDKCMCVYFKSPFSFTGDDVVEFQCHGGITLTNKIFEKLVECGCTPADKGEFSKLAFLNGKISLDEAEGIIDMINAESESELKYGYELMQGKLKNEITNIQTELTELLAKIEVTLDYPEEDLEEETCEDIHSKLISVKERLETLLSSASLGRAVKEGTKILIYGKTNAGKSSLLNSLLEYNRAIVTDIQGTTRDTLEETFEYRGFKFILIDTAGIRDSKDIVENIGIEKSKDMLNIADIVLFVVDNSRELDENDFNIISTLKDKKVIVVVNKCDLNSKINIDDIPFKDKIFISSATGENIDLLKEKLYEMVTTNNITNSAVVITNARHIDAIKKALDNTITSINSLNNGYMLDLVSIDIKNIWLHLGDITGNSNNEDIIDDIFSKFCVGK